MKYSLAQLRNNKRIIQFAEFMFGGAVFFWSGIIVFAVLYEVLNLHWLVAKIIADFTGMTLSFLIQRYWAFYDKRLEGRGIRVVIRYYTVNIMDFFSTTGL